MPRKVLEKENEQSAVRPEASEKFTQKFIEARPVTSETERKILNVAKTLAKIGDTVISFSKFNFRASRLFSHHYCCGSCKFRNSCSKTSRVKDIARELACIGDELMTTKHGVGNDCERLNLAFIVIFTVGIYAKFASFELNGFI